MNAPLADTVIPDFDVEQLFSEYAAQENLSIAMEIQRRDEEALALYEPLPFQEKFHACRAKECAVIAGNQVGKSLAGFVEDARIVTGQDPHDKYPKENGILVILGMDANHIGLVIYDYLFKTGRFNLIRDEVTGKLRTWKPWIPADYARKREAKPAPPLIPARFIKTMAWEKKAEHIFSVCELTTGWKIYAMGSKGDPRQGYACDVVHIDEDIERPDWYQEMLGRLTMREGLLRWTALPHVKNEPLMNLIERAEDQDRIYHEQLKRKKPEDPEPKRPSTVVFRATVFDNPFQDAETRAHNINSWKQEGEDVYRKRALGEPTTDSVLMYPSFARQVHGLKLHREDWEIVSELELVLAERGGIPPDDWTRYMLVDPGHQVCAVNFLAVPPPERFGDFRVHYEELYIPHCDANKFGLYVGPAARDQVWQAFIIDAHGGAIRDIGSGVTPREQYSAQLKLLGIRSEETGHGFLSGCDDVAGRTLKFRDWLYIRPDGTAKYRMLTEKCPHTIREFSRFRKKKIGDFVTDEPDTRTPCHSIQTLEYGAAHGLKYVRPRSRARTHTIVDRVQADRARRQAKRRAMQGLYGGSSINLGPQGVKS